VICTREARTGREIVDEHHGRFAVASANVVRDDKLGIGIEANPRPMSPEPAGAASRLDRPLLAVGKPPALIELQRAYTADYERAIHVRGERLTGIL